MTQTLLGSGVAPPKGKLRLHFGRNPDDETLKQIIALHRANAKDLGFVVENFFYSSRKKNNMLVVTPSGSLTVIGSCLFHSRRDGQFTIYEMVTAASRRGHGIGRAIIDQLKIIAAERGCSFLYAKCPQDQAANAFYARLGFELGQPEPGRKRPLNAWRLQLPLTGGLFDAG